MRCPGCGGEEPEKLWEGGRPPLRDHGPALPGPALPGLHARVPGPAAEPGRDRVVLPARLLGRSGGRGSRVGPAGARDRSLPALRAARPRAVRGAGRGRAARGGHLARPGGRRVRRRVVPGRARGAAGDRARLVPGGGPRCVCARVPWRARQPGAGAVRARLVLDRHDVPCARARESRPPRRSTPCGRCWRRADGWSCRCRTRTAGSGRCCADAGPATTRRGTSSTTRRRRCGEPWRSTASGSCA